MSRPRETTRSMPTIDLERTLLKSPPELWDELASDQGLSRWLGDVRVSAAKPPSRIEWNGHGARGVIELEPSGWGTKVRAQAEIGADTFWERLRHREKSTLEQGLEALFDDLGSSSLTSG
jgi:hypothetical protein